MSLHHKYPLKPPINHTLPITRPEPTPPHVPSPSILNLLTLTSIILSLILIIQHNRRALLLPNHRRLKKPLLRNAEKHAMDPLGILAPLLLHLRHLGVRRLALAAQRLVPRHDVPAPALQVQRRQLRGRALVRVVSRPSGGVVVGVCVAGAATVGRVGSRGRAGVGGGGGRGARFLEDGRHALAQLGNIVEGARHVLAAGGQAARRGEDVGVFLLDALEDVVVLGEDGVGFGREVRLGLFDFAGAGLRLGWRDCGGLRRVADVGAANVGVDGDLGRIAGRGWVTDRRGIEDRGPSSECTFRSASVGRWSVHCDLGWTGLLRHCLLDRSVIELRSCQTDCVGDRKEVEGG
ncbi:hypothetical protein HDK90DRAFT_538402 [Phyllosticta capitalensis]|uniref:Uncharacterized protein n=1 Tax=Phyllosticta capitalensis TaxID=121624 RepID=A0ABR1Z1I0_9PEZI